MILVDPPRHAHVPGSRYVCWCHLVSDTSAEELHAFADEIGLRREWSQERPSASQHHYDMPSFRRSMAVRAGAVEVSSKELVRRNYDGRAKRLDMAPPTKNKSPVRRIFAISDSKNIAGIGYDPETKTMELVFHDGRGEIYTYQNIGAHTYCELLNAESVGAYFAKNIKADPQRYPFTKRQPKMGDVLKVR